MYCIISRNGAIQYSSSDLKGGLSVIGRVYGLVKQNYTLAAASEADVPPSTSPAYVDAQGMFLFVENGRLAWVSPDYSGTRDVFYGKLEDGTWIVGDNFFEVISRFRSLALHESNIVFFIRQGYFPPGATFFREILRVRVGTKLVFEGGKVFEASVLESKGTEKPRTYEAFQKALHSALEVHGVGDNDAIFLSAGVDSGLLAVLSSKVFSKRLLAVTMQYTQTLKINEIDAVGSQRVADHLGFEHSMVHVDFQEESITTLEEMVERMPLAANLSIPFLRMSSVIAKRGIQTVWCGQNADSVYNFGPTEKTLGAMVKRFYFSRQYWESLPDITGAKSTALVWRGVGLFGPLAFRMRRGFQLRQPATFQELMHAYEESEDYIALPKKSQQQQGDSSVRPIVYEDAKHLFFDRKVQSFITGRDPRTVYAAAESYNVQAQLPYSTSNMLHFFRGLRLGMSDVIWPKQYIWRYLKELLGDVAFRKLYVSQEKYLPKKPYLNWWEWQKSVLLNTSFWSELKREIKNNKIVQELEKNHGPFFHENSPYHTVHLYWVERILARAKGYGVVIRGTR